MFKEGDKHVLLVKDIYGEDGDEYCCKAQNKGGTRMSRAELTIKCKYRSVELKRV